MYIISAKLGAYMELDSENRITVKDLASSLELTELADKVDINISGIDDL
jgi:hypothetical protein